MTKLKALRTKLGWSQREAANYLGCNQSTVSRIEAGEEPSPPMSRLIDHLERDVREKRIRAAERAA